MTSLSVVVPAGDSDTSGDEVFETAPNSPEDLMVFSPTTPTQCRSLPAPPVGDSDTSGDEIFETAPNFPEDLMVFSPTTPTQCASLPAPPVVPPSSVPGTPRTAKKVSWSPLPPKMDPTDRTPTRSISTLPQRVVGTTSLPYRPRETETPQPLESLVTPTQQSFNLSMSPPIFDPSPLSESDQSSSIANFRGPSFQRRRRYVPLPGNPMLPLDICADSFLKTKKFETICTLAMNIACMIPTDPPPQSFVSLDLTPMHPWFESLVAVFTELFARRLRARNAFPQKATAFAADGNITIEEDHVAFERELVAHVNALFHSININWALRVYGSYDNLLIDTTQRHAGIAAVVLREVTEKPTFPPKANWRVGESLHPFYKAQLRRFRGGVMRILEDWREDAWMLTVPEQLERGVAGYEEYYIGLVRRKILAHNGGLEGVSQ